MGLCAGSYDDVKPRGLEAPVEANQVRVRHFQSPTSTYLISNQKMETMQTDTSAGFFSTFLTKNKVVKRPETSPKLTTEDVPFLDNPDRITMNSTWAAFRQGFEGCFILWYNSIAALRNALDFDEGFGATFFSRIQTVVTSESIKSFAAAPFHTIYTWGSNLYSIALIFRNGTEAAQTDVPLGSATSIILILLVAFYPP